MVERVESFLGAGPGGVHLEFAILDTAVDYRATDSYRLSVKHRTPRWKAWLARKAWALLQQHGFLSAHQEEVKTYSYTRDHQGEILSRVDSALWRLTMTGESLNDYALVVGAADMHELTGAVFQQHNTMVLDQPFALGGYEAWYRGVCIHVIPAMRGTALIPKVVVEKRK